VPYYDNFWVTVGTAAPVIALAAVVSLPDVFQARQHRFDALLPTIERFLRDGPGTVNAQQRYVDLVDMTRGQTRLLKRANVIGLCNGFLQLIALLLALWSLADGKNVVSPNIAVIIVPLGILLLLLGTIMILRARSISRKISDFGFTQKSSIAERDEREVSDCQEKPEISGEQEPEISGGSDGAPST
jgi:hypothetical protein